jgi:hypothetical protein
MPLSAAQTVTAMGADQTRNVAGRQVVTVELVYDGVSFVPANLLTALTTQYGAGKVFADTDTVAQGQYRLHIVP